MLAAIKGQQDLVTKLIARDADINKPGWTPLHYAATSGQIAIMKLLLDKDAFIDAAVAQRHHAADDGGDVRLDGGGQAAARRRRRSAMKNQQGMTAADFAERGKSAGCRAAAECGRRAEAAGGRQVVKRFFRRAASIRAQP